MFNNSQSYLAKPVPYFSQSFRRASLTSSRHCMRQYANRCFSAEVFLWRQICYHVTKDALLVLNHNIKLRFKISTLKAHDRHCMRQYANRCFSAEVFLWRQICYYVAKDAQQVLNHNDQCSKR